MKGQRHRDIKPHRSQRASSIDLMWQGSAIGDGELSWRQLEVNAISMQVLEAPAT